MYFNAKLPLMVLNMLSGCTTTDKKDKVQDFPYEEDQGASDVPAIDRDQCAQSSVFVNPNEGQPDLCFETELAPESGLQFSQNPFRMTVFEQGQTADLAVTFDNGARTGDDAVIYNFNGDSFSEKQAINVGAQLFGVTHGDYDQDGDQDLAFAGVNGVYIYENNAGSYSQIYSNTDSEFYNSLGIAFATLGSGSDQDTAFVVTSENSTGLLYHAGAGVFVSEAVARGIGNGSTDDGIGGGFPAVCDLDDDGLDDILIPNRSRENDSRIPSPVYVQSSRKTFSEQSEEYGLHPEHDFSNFEATCAYDQSGGYNVVYVANSSAEDSGSAANDMYRSVSNNDYMNVNRDLNVVDNGNSLSASLVNLHPSFPLGVITGRMGNAYGLQFYVSNGETYEEVSYGFLSSLENAMGMDSAGFDLLGSTLDDLLVLKRQDGNSELLVYENFSQPIAE